MILLYPWALLLLLLIPGALYLRYARRRSSSLRYSDGQTLRALPVTWAVRARWILPVLFGASLVLWVIVLARPQKGLDQSRIEREAVDMVLVIDVSTSMRAEDFSDQGRRINRLEAVRIVIKKFIHERRSDRLGMIAFAGLPYTIAPLTFDHGWLLNQIDRAQIGMVEDGTAIGSALASGINRLRDSEAKSKVIILLTDGVNNMGTISPENAARLAEPLGIRVYTIGAGSRGLAPVPVQDPFGGTHYTRQMADIDEASLTRIADITGGKYFKADDFEALNAVYDEINELERTEMEVDEYTRYEERFMPFLMWALGLLALEQVLSLMRLGRWP